MGFLPRVLFSGLFASAVLVTSGKPDTSRTYPPSGCLVVNNATHAAPPRTYRNLTAAFASLGAGSASDSACIFIYPGTYAEQVHIKGYAGALTIYGYTEDASSFVGNRVVFTHAENSTFAGNDEGSSTVDITLDNFSMYNVNVTNSWGAGTQAIAITSHGNQQGFYGCAFTGYQDTLYAYAGYQYYKKCLIQGAVDYIFGDAQAWFEQCTMQSAGEGAITAMHRSNTSETTLYVINKSTIEAAPGYTDTGSVYLGRPWGVDARVIYQYCSLSSIINPAGWTTMAVNATPTFMEYSNSGIGATTTARQYETMATAAVSLEQLFTNGTAWINSSY